MPFLLPNQQRQSTEGSTNSQPADIAGSYYMACCMDNLATIELSYEADKIAYQPVCSRSAQNVKHNYQHKCLKATVLNQTIKICE